MSAHAHHGQLSVFDMLELPTISIGGCGRCVCNECMRWWQSRCPHGSCWDDQRAQIMPYDAAHGGKIRKLWSDWNKPGEQAHWCRGGSFYPAHMCEHYAPYIRPKVQYCLNAAVRVWADGTIDCSLVDAIGCEKCMKIWEERNTDDAL